MELFHKFCVKFLCIRKLKRTENLKYGKTHHAMCSNICKTQNSIDLPRHILPSHIDD